MNGRAVLDWHPLPQDKEALRLSSSSLNLEPSLGDGGRGWDGKNGAPPPPSCQRTGASNGPTSESRSWSLVGDLVSLELGNGAWSWELLRSLDPIVNFSTKPKAHCYCLGALPFSVPST